MIQWQCRQCSELLEIPESVASEAIECPKCGVFSRPPGESNPKNVIVSKPQAGQSESEILVSPSLRTAHDSLGSTKSRFILPLSLIAAICIAGVFLVVTKTSLFNTTQSAYADDRIGRVIDRREVVSMIKSAGIPGSLPEINTASDILTYEYDEFDNTHRFDFVVDQETDLTTLNLSYSLMYTGEKPDYGESLTISVMVFHDENDLRDSTSIGWIVDGIRFSLLPTSFTSVDGKEVFLSGSEWSFGETKTTHIIADLGVDLAEWIGKSTNAKFRFADETYVLTENDKLALLALCSISRQ